MTQVNISQKDFSAGEISPELEVRSDIENYGSALSDSLNVLCTNKGDLIPRPGTEFVAVTAGSQADNAPGRSRLIPFSFSENEAYMLEFTEKKLRIHRDGKPLSWTPVTGGPTYETIQSAHHVHEAQYPIVGGGGGGQYGTESGQFVFAGEGSFPYEAGSGPFIISDIYGGTISNLSYMHGSALNNTAEKLVLNTNVFWVHSVERAQQGVSYLHRGTGANNIIGKEIDIVRITWHPKFCEGGSAYDADKFLVALNGTTQRPSDANFPPTKWTFYTGVIKAAVSTDNVLRVTSEIDYVDHFGPTDRLAAGTATSPIPYEESELAELQYAVAGDLMFVTHPNHQPLKIERVGPSSFKVHNHHLIGGPWRPYPTYPNTYWGGGYFVKGDAAAALTGNNGSSDVVGPAPSGVDLRYSTNASQYVYLFKSAGTPDIITNADPSETESDDSIVGRYIRICLPVGTPLFSSGVSAVGSSTHYAWNDNVAYQVNTRTNSPVSSALNITTSATIAKSPRALGSIVNQKTLDSPAYFWFEGKVEALVNTSGTVRHKNPTEGFRIRITRGASFMRTTVSSVYIGPSTRTKIGRLFENVMPDLTGGWPRSVAIVNNRLVYASSQESPNVMAFSSSGNFDDFTPDDFGYNVANTISATDLNNWSVLGTYNAETFDYHSFVYYLQEGLADPIQWLKATNYGLIAGTKNGVYLAPRLPTGQAYTPFNFSMRLISEEGANAVQAEYIDGKIYYMSTLGDKLLSMEYINEVDGFRPRVESILSEHLIKSGVKSITYARTPINIIWLVTNDGTLVSAVRLDVSKDKAFFKHRIASADYNVRSTSYIDSVGVIPSDDKSFDQLYLSVRRPRAVTGVVATVPAITSRIHWTERDLNTLRSTELNYSDPQSFAATTPYASAMDFDASKLYWVDQDDLLDVNHIKRSDLDGTLIETLLSDDSEDYVNSPSDIALDSVNRKMYWVDANGIRRADMDGTQAEIALSIQVVGGEESAGEAFDFARYIALDLYNQMVYWTSYGGGAGKITRKKMDGTGPEEAVITAGMTASPLAIALDTSTATMYWTQSDRKVASASMIQANPATPTIATLFTGSSGEALLGIALDISNGKIYFTDVALAKIYIMNLDGGSKGDAIASLGYPQSVFVSDSRANNELFKDPVAIAEVINKEVNTVERLTQFSPFLRDSREFVGLDCSISQSTPYNGSSTQLASYKESLEITDAVNFNDSSAALSTDFRITTKNNHGISAKGEFMVSGFRGGMKFLNLAAHHVSNGVGVTNILETYPVEPSVVDSTSGFPAELYEGYAKVLLTQDITMPGKLHDKGESFDLSSTYFPSMNNFSLFRNGVLDLSVYTLGEKGSPSDYPAFSGQAGLSNFTLIPNNRVFYIRRFGGEWGLTSLFSAIISSVYPSSHNYYSYNAGFKPDIYITTLPPKINNQLGSADLSYVLITSMSAQVIDTHQIGVKNNSTSESVVNLIDDEYSSSEIQPLDVTRRSGTYKVEIIQSEEDTRGKLRLEPEVGYPFRLIEINIRGERATRG